jgi:hypothetical protein
VRLVMMAFALKIVGPWVAIWSVFPWFTGASYWTGFVYATWATLLGFAGDMLILPRIGNLAGTALDVAAAGVLLPIIVRKPVPLSGWFWLLASVALVEWLYHYVILTRRLVRRRV